MTDKLSEIQILFQKRNAPKRGPTSSDAQNDMADELAHDLTEIVTQWNNRLTPVMAGLPNGIPTSTVDAYVNGLDGANLYVDADATVSNNSSYFKSSQSRPNTVLEQFQSIYLDIAELQNDLENQINNTSLTASQVAVVDSGGLYVATNVETALAEVMTKANVAIASVTASTLDLTAYDSAIIPDTDDTYDFGSTAKKAKDIYFAGQLFVPQENDPTAPNLAFGDGDTGIYESADDTLGFAFSGSLHYTMSTNGFSLAGSTGFRLMNATASVTTPTLIPYGNDTDTGIGGSGADVLSIVVGGVQGFTFTETAGVVDAQLNAAGSHLLLPSHNDNVTPTLAFGDGDSGLYEIADDSVALTIGGSSTNGTNWTSSNFQSRVNGGFRLLYAFNTSAPTILPSNADTDTGFGQRGSDRPAIYAGGNPVFEVDGSGNTVLYANNVAGLTVTEASSKIRVQIDGQSWSPLASTVTPSGTTQTIDFDDSNSHTIDLEDATGDVTLTLSNPQSGASYIIKVIQDSTTPRNLVWPAAVLWPDGITPTISSGADAVDIISLFYDGTNYYGNWGPNYS